MILITVGVINILYCDVSVMCVVFTHVHLFRMKMMIHIHVSEAVRIQTICTVKKTNLRDLLNAFMILHMKCTLASRPIILNAGDSVTLHR